MAYYKCGSVYVTNNSDVRIGSASGGVANFNTSLALPIKSLEIDVNAVQASGTPTPATSLPISGWSQIKAYQRGINLWNENTEIGGIDDNGMPTVDNNRLRSVNFSPLKEGISVYVKKGGAGNINIFFYDINQNYLTRTGWTEGNATRNIPSGAYYFKIVLATQYGTTYNNDVSINYPSSDTEYHAYNPNGTTEVINLGGTYYGGRLTQDKAGHRQFEVTHKAKIKLRDVGYWNYSSTGNRFYVNNVSDVFQKIDWNNHIGLCDCYVEGRVGNNQGDDLAYGFYNASLYLRDSNYSDVTTWLNAVGDYYITYQLATPIIIDLPDGEPINTFAGVNNFFADTGDTEVVFKSSVNDYVSAHSGGNLLGMGGVYLGGGNSSESEGGE